MIASFDAARTVESCGGVGASAKPGFAVMGVQAETQNGDVPPLPAKPGSVLTRSRYTPAEIDSAQKGVGSHGVQTKVIQVPCAETKVHVRSV